MTTPCEAPKGVNIKSLTPGCLVDIETKSRHYQVECLGGDTIRVSLTEDPELEIPVCKDLVERYKIDYGHKLTTGSEQTAICNLQTAYSPFEYKRRTTTAVKNIGGKNVPIVIADFMIAKSIEPIDLEVIGYRYDAATDKWNIADAAADYIYTADKIIDYAAPRMQAITSPAPPSRPTTRHT